MIVGHIGPITDRWSASVKTFVIPRKNKIPLLGGKSSLSSKTGHSFVLLVQKKIGVPVFMKFGTFLKFNFD